MPFRLSPTSLFAVLQPWGEVNEPIHRRVAQIADAAAGQEALCVGCGAGAAVRWWARKYQTHVEGVDPDARAIENAERIARESGLAGLVSFQSAPATDLPHEPQVFDITLVEMLHLLGEDSGAVVREAARVARPMSTVIAIVPFWLDTPDKEDARILASFGLVPHVLVEWKGRFRDAGVVELTVEDAAKDARWISGGWLGIVIRAWRAAGWNGVRSIFSREFRVLRGLALRRILGLSIIKGTRWPHP
jgi:SAM-dependent methyltransferase